MTLSFQINKDCTLRTFVGPDAFIALVRRTIEIIGDQDRETRIILLDKILEAKLVLQTLIQLQWSQIEQVKPLNFVSPTYSLDQHSTQNRLFDQQQQQMGDVNRVAIRYKALLDDYRKKGHSNTYSHLFYVIEQLDRLEEAFEPISRQAVTQQALLESIKRLQQLRFLPPYKGINAVYPRLEEQEKETIDKFCALDSTLQEATLDCVIAISRISMQLRHSIYEENQVIRYERSQQAQKIRDDIKARKDYQEHLTSYVDLLASHGSDALLDKYEDRLGKYAQAMRHIQLELA